MGVITKIWAVLHEVSERIETSTCSFREKARMHSALDDEIAEQEDRQATLTSFIQKVTFLLDFMKLYSQK